MKKRFLTLCGILMLALSIMAQGKAKYVFYFIGDGMGVNQVNGAETYLAALEGRIGINELCFPSFPYSAFVNTQSASNGVTDSAAGGTALATGHKTKNGALGMLADLTTPVTSIADWAHNAGAAVGITTSVSVDHATPAAFYAHVPSRKQAYDIGVQLVNSNNDFYAGSDFVSPENPDKEGKSLYEQAADKGFTIAYGYKDYQKKARKADRMIMFQTQEANKRDRYSLPYAIDRSKGDLTLTDITRAAINFLTKKQGEKDGFFLMVEGGKIDWACHANDMCYIKELIDMDNAVKVAYEFYQQHPDETLIVVTADHETGGLVLGRKGYDLHLDVVGNQRMSIEKLGKELHKLHDKHGEKYKWDIVKAFLAENFGFWTKVSLSDAQTTRLQEAFNNIMSGKGQSTETLYQKDDELATTVRKILAECALVGWQTGGHSNGYVPCFAIGVGAEQFHGRIDNTEICKNIATAAGWKH
ncbi:MAG: alkaline phosphatase [Prevotella sp.]|nr:alkaline phosphatase [Prevotella sp.]